MNLDSLALKHRTDKSSAHHNYCVVYEKYFEPLRNKPVTLLELGVGGYKYSNRGGESLRMWCEYFKQGRIFAVDLYDKSQIAIPGNAKIFQGSQDNPSFLNHVISITGAPDIIIDDASHINLITIASFELLFPELKPGGIYVVEDTETSYWEEVATDGTDFKGCRNPLGEKYSSVINYFKWEADRFNLDSKCPYESIHFYKGLIIILKK